MACHDANAAGRTGAPISKRAYPFQSSGGGISGSPSY